jgi:hypothetical protein
VGRDLARGVRRVFELPARGDGRERRCASPPGGVGADEDAVVDEGDAVGRGSCDARVAISPQPPPGTDLVENGFKFARDDLSAAAAAVAVVAHDDLAGQDRTLYEGRASCRQLIRPVHRADAARDMRRTFRGTS